MSNNRLGEGLVVAAISVSAIAFGVAVCHGNATTSAAAQAGAIAQPSTGELDRARRAVITPENVARLKPLARLNEDKIFHITWTRDPNQVAVVRWQEPVEIRDATSFKLLKTVKEGKKIINFAYSPDEGVVAFSENGSTSAKILDLRTGKSIDVDARNDQPQVDFSPDGTMLVTGGYGKAVRLWRVRDGELLWTFDTGPVEGGLTPLFSPDGRLLAVGNRNSTTTIFEVATKQLLQTLPKPSSQELRFHPSGRILAVTYVDASVALWRVSDGSLISERATSAEELYSVDWSPSGQLLVTAGREGKITLWNPAELSVIRELQGPEWVVRVKFSPDGRGLYYAGGETRAKGKRWLEVFGVEEAK